MKKRILTVYSLVVPIAGIAIFVVLYFVAARFYPGGSNANPTHKGFDWINNYWCDLIASYGKNGSPNTGRTIALTAMITLFASLSVFWFRLPDFFRETQFARLFIGYSGIIAMLILVFVFTPYHDAIILIGGSLSAIPFVGTLRELYRNRWRFLFLFGSFCMALILLNFYSYLSGWLVSLLPLIQKITLVFFLGWVLLISLNCILLLRSRKRLAANTCHANLEKVNYGLDKRHCHQAKDQ